MRSATIPIDPQHISALRAEWAARRTRDTAIAQAKRDWLDACDDHALAYGYTDDVASRDALRAIHNDYGRARAAAWAAYEVGK